jgi:hypothetical protein
MFTSGDCLGIILQKMKQSLDYHGCQTFNEKLPDQPDRIIVFPPYRGADKSLARPGRKQATSMSKSSWVMDPTRWGEMPSCSAIDLVEIRRSSKISSRIWSIISGVVGLRAYQHPGSYRTVGYIFSAWGIPRKNTEKLKFTRWWRLIRYIIAVRGVKVRKSGWCRKYVNPYMFVSLH